MSRQRHHRERASYRWVGLTGEQVSRLAALMHPLGMEVETRLRDGGDYVAWVGLDEPDCCSAVGTVVAGFIVDEAEHGVYLSLSSSAWSDSIQVQPAVTNLIRRVAGVVDFSFTSLPDDEDPTDLEPDRHVAGVSYLLTFAAQEPSAIFHVRGRLGDAAAGCGAGTSDTEGMCVVDVSDEASCVAAAGLLKSPHAARSCRLSAIFTTYRDSDRLRVEPFVLRLFRDIGGDLEFSFVMLPDPADCGEP